MRNTYLPNEFSGQVFPESKRYALRWIAPEAWHVDSRCNLQDTHLGKNVRRYHTDERTTAFTIQAGERVDAVNRIVLEVTSAGRSMPVYVPITVLG